MQTQIGKIKEQMTNFVMEADKTDNKSAARRARKISLVLQDLLKQYRKNSIK